MTELTDAKPRVFRSSFGRAMAYIWFAFAAFNVVDVLRRGEGQSARVAVAILFAVSVLAYVVGLRPRVEAGTDRLTIRNPLRDIAVPWSAITRIDATDALRVHVGERAHRAFAVSVSNRARNRALRQPARGRQGGAVTTPVEQDMVGRTNADFVVDELTQTWVRERSVSKGEPGMSWSIPAVALTALAAALLVGVLLTG